MALQTESEPTGTSLLKVAKIGFLVFLVLLVVLAVVAYFLGNDRLPMEYEGFD